MAAEAPKGETGFTAPGFELPATDGRLIKLADIAGKKGTVVAFICNHCPYVIAIIDRLVRDANDLAPLGVSVVAICSNDADAYPEDSFANMKLFANEHSFSFPYLHDAAQDVARFYGAVCTPDFFGFDADLSLQYRGRLDASRNVAGPLSLKRDLFDAMRAIAQTGAAPADQPPALGCSIKWRGKP
ncbi:MAG: thioredoxin family protein [Alphaproteobacteria bacterium]|nr:thioredoxin family protein [Alphaproteobacteria bacterium]